MSFYLKGITNSQTIIQTLSLGLTGYSFDLRPKSFNFVQAKKIKEMLKVDSNSQYTLIFENEKDFMVNELYKQITQDEMASVLIEFTGVTGLNDLDSIGKNFVWHYHHDEKFMMIERVEHLKRIVFNHKDLEFFQEKGELFGFLNLFQDLKKQGIEFEILLDWDTALIESMFDYFDFDAISLEINNKVEISYQIPDIPLITNHLLQLKNLFK